MTFTPPPTPPNSGDPANFNDRADAFLAWMAQFASEIDAAGYPSIPLYLPNGTASAPALGFASDTDTGIYRIGPNQLGVATGGTERVRVSSAGMQVTGLITGTAVTQSATDTTAGRLMTSGYFGLGATLSLETNSILDGNDALGGAGFFGGAGGSGVNFPAGANVRPFLNLTRRSGSTVYRTMRMFFGSGSIPILRESTDNEATWGADTVLYGTTNTTVDSNGFIKSASPIVRLFADRTEEPVETVGSTMTRQGVGSYTLSGVPPLATDGWQIEVPQDHNGNRLVFVETSYTGDTLTVTTSKPVWSMETMSWAAGDPVDIPDGRWVDLRFWKDPTLEEDPDEE